MWISWASGSETDQAVNWGETSGSLGSSAVANTTSYTFSGGYTSPFLHHAQIGGLKPGTKYYYTVGSADECGVSSEMSFTSNPGPGAAPYVFGLLGDPGQTSNSADTFQHIQAGEVQAVMLVGDLSYAGKWTVAAAVAMKSLTYQSGICAIVTQRDHYVMIGLHADGDQPRWDSWGNLVQPLSSSMAINTQLGNHEIEGTNFLP